MEQFLYKHETYINIGACFEVYNEMGCGFLESVYQECLELELGLQTSTFRAQQKLVLKDKGRTLEKKFEPDFICFDRISGEIKAVSALTDEHRAQLINDLHATGMEVGLLVNFGKYHKLEHECFVCTTHRHLSRSVKSAQSVG
jgi:GxxExxY protein